MLGKPARKRRDASGIAIFEYDFDKHGGAIGAIELSNDVIPDDAVIIDGFIDVKAALTSGGSATIGFFNMNTGDIKALTAVATYSIGAILDIVPVGTIATMVKSEFDINHYLTMVIAVDTLLTGKLSVCLRYVVTDTTTLQAASESSSSESSESSESSTSSESSSSESSESSLSSESSTSIP